MIAAVRVAGSRRKARSTSSRTMRRTSSSVMARSPVTAGAGWVSGDMGHLRGCCLLGAGELGAGCFGSGSPGPCDVAEDRFGGLVPLGPPVGLRGQPAEGRGGVLAEHGSQDEGAFAHPQADAGAVGAA